MLVVLFRHLSTLCLLFPLFLSGSSFAGFLLCRLLFPALFAALLFRAVPFGSLRHGGRLKRMNGFIFVFYSALNSAFTLMLHGVPPFSRLLTGTVIASFRQREREGTMSSLRSYDMENQYSHAADARLGCWDSEVVGYSRHARHAMCTFSVTGQRQKTAIQMNSNRPERGYSRSNAVGDKVICVSDKNKKSAPGQKTDSDPVHISLHTT